MSLLALTTEALAILSSTRDIAPDLADPPGGDSRARPICLIGGSVKAGKSTLLNELVGERLLPDDKAVTLTRTYGRLVFSEEPTAAAWAVRVDGSREQITVERARSLLAKGGGEDDLVERLDRVELATLNQLLRTFDMEDSPGTDDAMVGNQFVRQDVPARAAASTLFVYCIKGIPASSDALLLRPLMESGVPVHVVFTRFDEVDPDEEEEDPRRARLSRLRSLEITVPAERVHFVSAWESRRGNVGGSGVAELLTALRHDSERVDLAEARGLRRLSGWASSAASSLSERAAEVLAEVERELARRERTQMRAAVRLQAEVGRVYEEFAQGLALSASELGRAVRDGARSEPQDLARGYRTEWGPAWRDQVEHSISAFGDGLRVLALEGGVGATPRPLEPVRVPTVAFPSPPGDLDIDATEAAEWLRILRSGTGESAGVVQRAKDWLQGGGSFDPASLGPLTSAGRQMIRQWKQERWVVTCGKRADAAIQVTISNLLQAAARRCDSVVEEAMGLVAEEREEASIEQSKDVTALDNASRRLRMVASRAIDEARSLVN